MPKNCHEPISICLIALGAYPLLVGNNPDRVVGPDVNQFILGEELKKHDFKISFICYDDSISKIEEEYIDGMQIMKIPNKRGSYFPINRIKTSMLLIKSILKMDSKIYFHHIPGISIFIRLLRKKSIYRIGSDGIVDKELIKRKVKEFNQSKYSLQSFLIWLEIKLASEVVVQNNYQQLMLMKNFNRRGKFLRKMFPIPSNKFKKKTGIPIVLWVGTMAEVKQPELFLQLARECSEAHFMMIGGYSGDPTLYKKIKNSAEEIPNLKFLGPVPFHEIDKYFQKASILVNTSLFEAYPNFVLIQAWMNYLPVISLGDNSNNIISQNNLGFHSKTFERMVTDLKALIEDGNLREVMGKNGRNYVKRTHDIPVIIPDYIKFFNSIMDIEI